MGVLIDYSMIYYDAVNQTGKKKVLAAPIGGPAHVVFNDSTCTIQTINVHPESKSSVLLSIQ